MAANDDDVVRRVAVSVADASPVDVEDVVDGDGRIEQLLLVARLSEAFRSAARNADTDPGPPAGGPDELFRWGHLHVLERLGSGSFGEVFRAWDPVLERDVALKLRHPDADRTSSGQRRFLDEARLLARVRHPNVLTVHGADLHDGRAGLWTDLVDGQTLEERLSTDGPLGAAEAAVIGTEVCRALAAVHGAGLVHGDVKAANVMRERGGRIVLMDFGACADGATGLRAPACGTPLAMAPEVLRGERPGPRSDVYSAGVLLYRLVSGRHPVEAPSVSELIAAHESGARTLLSDRRPGLPRPVVAVIERALDPDPARRFATAGAMEAALADSLPRTRTWPSSWKAVAATAAAAAALGIVVATAVLRPSHGIPDPARLRHVAVLPFAVDARANDAFLGAALAGGIAARLQRVPDLRIAPTADTLRWLAGHPDPHEVGERLGVPAYVDGRVERAEGRIRMTVELVATADGATVFTRTVSGAAGDVYDLEHSAARSLVRALDVHLDPATARALATSPSVGADVVEAELAGAFYGAKHTAAALSRSVEAYHRAIRLAPERAPAHAGLARAWVATRLLDDVTPPEPGWARHAAARALELDPGLAAAHAAMGAVALWLDWDWWSAERELARAMELAPDDPDPRRLYAELLSVTGRHEEAITAIEKALALDPRSPSSQTVAGSVLLEAGRFDDAVAHLERAVALDPTYPPAYSRLAAVHEETGMFDDAVEQWQNALTLAGAPASDAVSLGRTYASFGMTGVWRWRLERLDALQRRGGASPALLARAHAALGHADDALAWMERAVDEHDPHLLVVKEEPAFDTLRTDLRFAALRSSLDVDVLPAVNVTATAAPAAAHPPLVTEATLYRDRQNRSESLATGATVYPGDRLYLALTATAPVHVYIFDEDRRGGLFALFPQPGLDLANPLRPRLRYRLPGPARGVEQDWTVTTAGGRETILLVASLVPLEELEREAARLADASAPTPPASSTVLRGISGLTSRTAAAGTGAGGRLTAMVSRLTAAVDRGEVFVREFVLDGSGP